ncbi:phosphoadenosine phosphosulfate reductase family protein [Methylobacterium sp. J-059]|uniref:phosphoadenosine phosphosulfate reductase domain-containing protein n=1 Tax=Methylobacterium sp. J-059 TaxID=2836643 RepID=UPI001FB9620C|nr:phosphoadenosine phosphosulfate reductase family protein [Methylobacterium sp. J-059]MCJ2041653.1 phosphoadenosine phosphosulfate reductase family protein [Methylobacterium sp. J-059]
MIPCEQAAFAAGIQVAQQALAALFDRYDRAYVLFSGGKDSAALAHLCRPWQDRTTLLWVNADAAPFMRDHVLRHRADFEVVELRPDRPMVENWQEWGVPADLVAVENLATVGWREPKVQPWLSCCGVHRVQPAVTFMEGVRSPCPLLIGQRTADGGGTVAGLASAFPAHIEVAMPLWSWTDAEVWTFVAEQGIRLHPHHAECPTSIECVRCPANLSAEKLRLLDRLYPEDAASARNAARYTLAAAAAKATEALAVLNGTGRAAREIRS